MANGASMRLADKADDIAPYFSVVLVAGWLDRPGSASVSGAVL